MSSCLSDTIRRAPVLLRRHRRARKPIEQTAAISSPEITAVFDHRRVAGEDLANQRRRPCRPPRVLTLAARRIARRNLPEAVVPYLRMSGRWLEEHGFAIGAGVQLVVEQGRVTISSLVVKPV